MPVKHNECKDCIFNRGDKYCGMDGTSFWEDKNDPGECKLFVKA